MLTSTVAGLNINTLLKTILQGEYSLETPNWDGISDEAKDCVRKLLSVNVKNRLNEETLLAHPWIASHMKLTTNKKLEVPASTQTIRATVSSLSGGRTMTKISVPSIMLTPTTSPKDLSKSVAFATLANARRSFEVHGLVSFFSDDAEFMSIPQNILPTMEIVQGDEVIVTIRKVLRRIQDLGKERATRLSDLIASDIETVSCTPQQDVSAENFWNFYEAIPHTRTECTLGVLERVRRTSDGRQFVVKTVRKNEMTPGEILRMEEENRILKMLDADSNVVTLQAVVENKRWIRTVYSCCDGGSLEDMINLSPDGKLSEEQAARVVTDLGRLLGRMHRFSIAHRNLCAENVLFTVDGTPKLADFFWADHLRVDPSQHVMVDLCGSTGYCAPEMLRKEEYGVEVDFWSLGVLLYYMLSGSMPFSGWELTDE